MVASHSPVPLAPAATRLTWRVLVTDQVLVTWHDLLDQHTTLTIRRPNGELTLSRTTGPELPPDDFCRIVEEVAAVLRMGPPAPAVVARWTLLCDFEPELVEMTRDWPTIKLRGAMEHVARVSIPSARVYARMLLSSGEWRKAADDGGPRDGDGGFAENH